MRFTARMSESMTMTHRFIVMALIGVTISYVCGILEGCCDGQYTSADSFLTVSNGMTYAVDRCEYTTGIRLRIDSTYTVYAPANTEQRESFMSVSVPPASISVIEQRGWPFRSHVAWMNIDASNGLVDSTGLIVVGDHMRSQHLAQWARYRLIPLRPLWSGLLLNAALITIIMFVCSYFFRQVLQRCRRLNRCCANCGYRIEVAGERCSECGLAHTVSIAKPPY